MEHAIQIAKMSGISSAANTTVNVILLHVVKDIPVPVTLQSQVLIGDPSDEIIKFANDEQVDLIIMGITGLSRFSKFVFGSVARNVSEKAKCPVMLVR